jgi:hypothetical protein
MIFVVSVSFTLLLNIQVLILVENIVMQESVTQSEGKCYLVGNVDKLTLLRTHNVMLTKYLFVFDRH